MSPPGTSGTSAPRSTDPSGHDEAGAEHGDTLFWLSVVIQRKYAEICAEFDLTPAQATLVCAVRNTPRRMADLAASLGMTRNALSQLVDRTERLELVGRAGSAEDRRSVLLGATPAGKVLGDAVFAEIVRRLPEIARHLGADERRDFERAAAAIVETSELAPSAAKRSVAG